MSRIDFYHLTNTNIYKALDNLLEKVSLQKRRVIIRTDSIMVAEEIDEMLWTYNLSKFIPHSIVGDRYSGSSPIHITNESENPNRAEFLFIINIANLSASEMSKFERTFVLFDSNDPEVLQSAQKLWAELANIIIDRHYWTQKTGGWELEKLP